jgi:hypothetical protein
MNFIRSAARLEIEHLLATIRDLDEHVACVVLRDLLALLSRHPTETAARRRRRR